MKLKHFAIAFWLGVAAGQPLPAPPAQTSGAPPPSKLSIDQAVAEAIANNLDLLAERQNVPVAKAREIQAALRPNPVLTFAWDYQDWLRRSLTVENNGGPSEWRTQVDYLIERGGKRERRVDLARLVTSVNELRLLDTMRVLGLNVRQACVEQVLAKANVELARQNLAVFSDMLRVNEAKVKAGEVAGVELIRVRVAQQQFENALAQAELRLAMARNGLEQLLARKSHDAGLEISDPLKEDGVVLLADEVRATALAQRPDLQAARKDVERAAADGRLQSAMAKQDVTASLAYHNQYGYSNGRTFGTYVSVPLPVYNRNQGEILRAQRETEQAGTRVRALESAIATEAANAWQQYDSAWRMLDRIRGRLMSEARQVRDITEYSYRRGEASLLEFLDAQRAYNDAMQSYNDARSDYMKSLFLIDAVTGKAVNP